jgi:excisionase family DNA binding protein
MNYFPDGVTPLVVTAKTAQQMLGIGETKLYRLIKSGELESYMDGEKMRRITTASILKRHERLLEESRIKPRWRDTSQLDAWYGRKREKSFSAPLTPRALKRQQKLKMNARLAAQRAEAST